MTQYVDGFLLPVPADKIDAYRDLANIAGEIWMEHGALAYWETVGDEPNAHGPSFTSSAGTKEGELVVLAWVVYPSKEDRDRIMAAVMADERLKNCSEEMPFDMGRMAYGGFKPLVMFNKS